MSDAQDQESSADAPRHAHGRLAELLQGSGVDALRRVLVRDDASSQLRRRHLRGCTRLSSGPGNRRLDF